jgi:cell pole-organizing protein PopZ
MGKYNHKGPDLLVPTPYVPEDEKEAHPSDGKPTSVKLLLDSEVKKIDKPVKLLPLPQPPLRARMDAQTNPSAQRATQLRSVLARVHAVARQNQITTTVP